MTHNICMGTGKFLFWLGIGDIAWKAVFWRGQYLNDDLKEGRIFGWRINYFILQVKRLKIRAIMWLSQIKTPINNTEPVVTVPAPAFATGLRGLSIRSLLEKYKHQMR